MRDLFLFIFGIVHSQMSTYVMETAGILATKTISIGYVGETQISTIIPFDWKMPRKGHKIAFNFLKNVEKFAREMKLENKFANVVNDTVTYQCKMECEKGWLAYKAKGDTQFCLRKFEKREIKYASKFCWDKKAMLPIPSIMNNFFYKKIGKLVCMWAFINHTLRHQRVYPDRHHSHR